ncbi:MAG: glycosyltransferase [Pseudomonadota bacterium]|nr:glycosyltransferase [Pseudomonadota bacterium]MDE3038918.1 glycosyltransferase [Pseudomonadota bacterium]
MSCSVIMVTLRSCPGLLASVKSVLAQRELAELIVADCGAWPDVLARLQQMALTDERIKVITGQQVGFSAACNATAKQATGDFLLLLSSDFLLPPGALADVMAAFREAPNAVVAGLSPLAATPQQFIGLRAKELMAVPISFFCVKAADYQRLAGLEESFSLQAAGLDFCARARAGGGRVIALTQLAVARLPSETTVGWRGTKDMLRYQYRHFWKQHKSPWLPLSCLVTLARYALNSARGENGQGISTASRRLMTLAVGLADLPETHEFTDKTVIVTGAAGSIGLCVVRRMLAAGASVTAVSSEPVAFPHMRLTWIKASLAEAALPTADIAVHCAPLWQLPPEIERLAAAGARRIIAIGSTAMYTHALSKNRHERQMAARLAAAEGEIASRCAGLETAWTILRPTLTYGTRLDGGIASAFRFIHRFGFFPIYPPALGRRQPVHADDVAMAALQAIPAAAAARKSYNLSGGEILTCRELLERLFAVSHLPARLVVTRLLPLAMGMASALFRRASFSADTALRMNDDLIFFHDEAEKDFGFAPRLFLSGGIHDLEGF